MARFSTVLLIPAFLFAQDATIRVSTRLVEVNVVVRDSRGPISGLTKNDFRIFDKGKERQIEVFTISGAPPKPAADSAAKAAPPIPPGVSTNRPRPTGDAPSGATVLLIDVLNTELADQQTAQKHILKFLASLDPNRRVAIYLLSRRIRVLQDFTDDPQLLMKAVRRSQGEPSGLLAGGNQPTPLSPSAAGLPSGADDVMAEAFAEMRDALTIDRVGLTLAAMEQIANHLAQVPGRKSLIWISNSFPFFLINDERHNFTAANRENRTFQLEIDRASRALNAADVAIYPVDSRGLLGMPDFDVKTSGPGLVNPRGRAFGSKGNGQLGALSVDTPEGFESMQALAAGTGGVAFFNTNDINGAIGKAMSDADLSYTLGFYADSAAMDGSFHELKVKVDRPGADVRHRKGYLASYPKAPGANDLATILRDTAASALDATAIGLIAAIDQPKPGSFRLALRIDCEDLSLEKQNGRRVGGIDIAYVSQSADGRTLALVTKKISLDLTEESYAAKRRDGLILEQTIEQKQGCARIRVAAFDERSGATGSLTVPLPK